MRRFVVAAALLAGGCLYTDPVNQRPVIHQMQVAPPPTRSDRDVTVTYDVYDPDGDSFDVHAAVLEVPAILAGRYEVQFRPTGPGRYTVVVSARDELGADSGERQIIVDVPNMTPQVSAPDVTADPNDGLTLHPLGTKFNVTPSTIDDDDSQPSDVKYFLTGPSGMTELTGTQKTFTALVPGMYQVSVEVTDVHSAIGRAMATVFVAEDRPPCILGTTPDARIAQLPAFVGEAKRLIVTRVDDDLNPWPQTTHGAAQFEWQIKNPGDSNFRVIAGWTQPYFDLDGTTHTVGDLVEVRVVVSDPAHAAPACPADQRECDYVSACPGWLTWNLEYFAP